MMTENSRSGSNCFALNVVYCVQAKQIAFSVSVTNGGVQSHIVSLSEAGKTMVHEKERNLTHQYVRNNCISEHAHGSSSPIYLACLACLDRSVGLLNRTSVSERHGAHPYSATPRSRKQYQVCITHTQSPFPSPHYN